MPALGMLSSMDKNKILSRLQSDCSRREYSTGQIQRKLDRYILSKAINDKESEEIINDLIRDKFVDNSRFASAYVKDKYNLSGWGRRKIEFHLTKERVPKHIIKESIDSFYPDKEQSDNKVLIRILDQKLKSLDREEDIYKKKVKAIRFAMGRGFDYDEIVTILNKLL